MLRDERATLHTSWYWLPRSSVRCRSLRLSSRQHRSHTVESQVSLRRLQACHGLNTAHADWAESTFGVPGPELPCTILESTPGDVLFTHNSLFHAVYNHRPDRQMMQCPRPVSPAGDRFVPFLCV